MSEQQYRGRKFAGDLYGRRYGSDDPFQKLGNLTELKTNRDVDTEELNSTGRDDWGEAIESVSKPGATEISLAFNTFNKDGMARALMGEAIDLPASEQTITETEITVSEHGWNKLPFEDVKVSDLVVKKSSGGTAIDAEKYEVNPRLGMIRFKAGSGITGSATKVKVSGKTAGTSGYSIDAQTLQSLPMELYLDGKDRITGKSGIVAIAHAELASNGDLDWMSDDWWSNGVTGKLIKDEGKPTLNFTEYND